MLEGLNTAKILFVSDFLTWQAAKENVVLADEHRSLIVNALSRAGISSDDYAFTVIHPETPAGGKDANKFSADKKSVHYSKAIQTIQAHKANVIVPLGEYALKFITGLDSIFKQHLSILSVKAEFGQRKAIPLLHPSHVMKAFGDSAYISFGCMRLREEMTTPQLNIPERKFLLSLDMTFNQVIEYLNDSVLTAPELSVDIETGAGVINTVGIAISSTESISIETHPRKSSFLKTPEEHYTLWKTIERIWSSDIPKIAQNSLYEAQWASRYGVRLNNVIHDTMWAMKILHPELEKGLDNVGRLYTRYPYWKDDHSDWNHVRDWRRHLEYNGKDCTGQFEAYKNQRKALEARKLDKLFYDYIMRFFPIVLEMCSKGINLDETKLLSMRADAERDSNAYKEQLQRIFEAKLGYNVNIRSPKQLKSALVAMGIKIPVVKGKESTDKKSLAKLRRKYPDAEVLPPLIEVSKINKQLSSYLGFSYPQNKKIYYSIDPAATETGRWAGYTDPWGNGFNPQTVPKKIRNVGIAEPNKVLVQIDLKQAESRYVAYQAPEPKLMEMLENNEDVHSYVASKIFNKPTAIINKTERQLGKKSGHSANYGVGPDTFADACLAEMGVVLTRQEANRIIQGYYEVFPGIRKRQENIQAHIRRYRSITTPFGRERTFYGRMGDQLFREAYAYEPQSAIPDITNHLLLFLYDNFDWADYLLQIHDAILLQVPEGRASEIAEAARDYQAWHPEINLAGGRLIIPVDVEVGYRWGAMEVI